MRVLVTGADGMLGRRVVQEAGSRGHAVRGTDLPELDLTDPDAVAAFVAAEAPDAVIHCAAYTDVDAAEADEALATRVNGDAAGNVARAAPYVVAVSTDYVFAGDATEPYTESSPPDPRTAYGRSKLAGERAVQAAGAQHAIVRTAWLYGAAGRNFVDTILGLASGRDELRVVDDQVGCPTATMHLARATLELVERCAPGIYHLAGGGSTSWHGFASAIMQDAGLRARVQPIPSSELQRPAPRPACSILRTVHADAPRLPHWRDGLRDCLAALANAEGT
jgi:dTDP-4-dehydrorhamnose reductase